MYSTIDATCFTIENRRTPYFEIYIISVNPYARIRWCRNVAGPEHTDRSPCILARAFHISVRKRSDSHEAGQKFTGAWSGTHTSAQCEEGFCGGRMDARFSAKSALFFCTTKERTPVELSRVGQNSTFWLHIRMRPSSDAYRDLGVGFTVSRLSKGTVLTRSCRPQSGEYQKRSVSCKGLGKRSGRFPADSSRRVFSRVPS